MEHKNYNDLITEKTKKLKKSSVDKTFSPIDLSKNIINDVEFSDTVPLESQQKKRRRRISENKEKNDLEKDEYDRQMHEQRYKRFMHLLDRSKFYSSYLLNKINQTTEKENAKIKREKRSKAKKEEANKTFVTDENVPPQKVGKKKFEQCYDIRQYITTDMKKKLNSRKMLNLNEDEIKEELLDNFDTEPINELKDIPKYFNGSLYDYQIEGFQWLKVLYENGVNGILGDEMGLGKTIQVIALLCHLIEKRQDGPYLIIVPLSTMPNWSIEFNKFAPLLPVVMFYGSRIEKQSLYTKIKQKYRVTTDYSTQPIVITSYESILRESIFLRSQKWRYIIIDEAQRIKNHQCQLSRALKGFQSMNRLLLTGTPLQNNLAELWSLLNFALPEIFDDLAVFESWCNIEDLQCNTGTEQFLKQEEEKHVISALRDILKPFMLRRIKRDVKLNIPPKKELIVYAPITKLQHELYEAVLNRDIHMLSKISEEPLIIDNSDGTRPKRRCALNKVYDLDQDQQSEDILLDKEVDKKMDSISWKNLNNWKQYTDITERNREYLIHIHFQNRLVMYKKIINHPYLVHCPLDPVGLPKIDDDLIKSSGKLLVLDAMLAKLKTQGHKVLLFSTMTKILDVIEDYLSMRDYNYVRLDGSVKIEDRQERIESFNSDPTIFLFLISTRCGGVGLNLTAADTVIIYDSDWNPQADIQAMARCHRIGQTRPVMIYKLCTKGTIDETILKRAEAKRTLEKLVISKEAQVLNLNSKEAIMELKRLLESKEYEIVTSKKKVFTEAELNKLLDRSDILNEVENNSETISEK